MIRRPRFLAAFGGLLFIVACATGEAVTDSPVGMGGDDGDASVGGTGGGSGASGAAGQGGASAGASGNNQGGAGQGSGGEQQGGEAGSPAGGSAGAGGSVTGGSAGQGGTSTGGAAGKGGSSTGGSAGKGGSSTGGASGTGGASTGGAAGTGGSAGIAGTAGSATCSTSTGLGTGCDTCMKTYCMAECVACESNPDCIAIRDCTDKCKTCVASSMCDYDTNCQEFWYSNCGYSDTYCSSDCANKYPSGSAQWSALTDTSSGCLANNCTAGSECGAACAMTPIRQSSAWGRMLIALGVAMLLRRARRG